MGWRVGIISAVLLLVAGFSTAFAQTTKPTENLIHRAGAATSPSSPASGSSGWQVAGSLAAVLILIVGLYWVSRRILPNGALGTSSTRAIHVLGRTHLSAKQRVILLQVGKRIIVIGEGGGQLTALAQITDPDEVASLIGQLGSDQRGAMSAFLERAVETPGAAGSPDHDVAVTRQELDGLMQQVRNMSQQIGRG